MPRARRPRAPGGWASAHFLGGLRYVSRVASDAQNCAFLVYEVRVTASHVTRAAAVSFGEASGREEVMADLLQVERLAAVGRLWGKAKLFHPHLATRAIDWDGALIEALAKTREARSKEDFRAAVDGLLTALGDPQTFSWAPRNPSRRQPRAPRPPPATTASSR